MILLKKLLNSWFDEIFLFWHKILILEISSRPAHFSRFGFLATCENKAPFLARNCEKRDVAIIGLFSDQIGRN